MLNAGSTRKREKSPESKSKRKKEEIPDSVLSFLEQMDQIDQKLGHSPTKKSVEKSSSFLSEVTRHDQKVLKSKDSQDSSQKKRIRLSHVKASEAAEAGVSSTILAKKRQSNNPVRAMLERFNKARIESQTQDIEDQLCLLTGQPLFHSLCYFSRPKLKKSLKILWPL